LQFKEKECWQINNFTIFKKISLWFGVIFIIFTVLAGVINYLYNHVVYTSSAPASLFIYSVLTAILPYLLAAVISFVTFALISKEQKPPVVKEEPDTEEPKPKEPEAQEIEKLFLEK